MTTRVLGVTGATDGSAVKGSPPVSASRCPSTSFGDVNRNWPLEFNALGDIPVQAGQNPHQIQFWKVDCLPFGINGAPMCLC
jgi:hypothetical protein